MKDIVETEKTEIKYNSIVPECVRASKKRRGSKIHNALIKKRASLD
jgi:hypothetical protein